MTVQNDLRHRKWMAYKRSFPLYLLLAPAVVYMFIYGYMTFPYIWLAFVRYNVRQPLFGMEFVGLKNFEFFFKSQSAWTVSWNTIKFNLISIGGGTILSLGIAILLNELASRKFVRVAQSVIIFPYFISWTSVHFMLYNLFGDSTGLINNLLKALGQQPVFWYGDAKIWTYIISGVLLWKSFGMNTVIYLAAIMGVDQEIMEAGMIDGAGRFQRIIHIMLPAITPTVCILVLMSVGKIFYGDFGMIYALIGDNGVLYPTTDIVDTYVFRALRKTGDPSTAMAVSLFQSLIGFGTVLASNMTVKRLYPDGALF